MPGGRVVYDLLVIRGLAGGPRRWTNGAVIVAATWSKEDGMQRWHNSDTPYFVSYLRRFDQPVAFNVVRSTLPMVGVLLGSNMRASVVELRRRTADLGDAIRRSTGLKVTLNQVALDTLGRGVWRPPWDIADLEDRFHHCEQNVHLIRDLDDYRRAFGIIYLQEMPVRLPPGLASGDEAA